MNRVNQLFRNNLSVLNIGAEVFIADLQSQAVPVVQLDWKPPAGGNAALIKALDRLADRPEIDAANAKAVGIIQSARPVLVDIGTALDVVPGMSKTTILHAGPPITWDRMAGPMRGAVIGALIYEGLAADEEQALKVAASGEITFAPCHEHNAVGPMAGIISASMPVQIIENKTHGNFSYCTLNEGLGKVLRFGAYSPEVITRLKWIETELAPALKAAISQTGGIDIRSLIAQTIAKVLDFINSNDHFFLNLSMPACKAALDAAHGIEHSTVVTTMARNGTDFGIRVSGCPGNTWFIGPAQYIKGLLFPGYTEDDANPDMGDSAITETYGIGGFAMGGAPAIVQFVGGTVADAIGYTTKMYEITLAENSSVSIPNLNFRGAPTGIDVRKVVETGILPHINTGIAHKQPGIGQVGAGIVNPPWECFRQALLALAEK
jgi:hypothetical protein